MTFTDLANDPSADFMPIVDLGALSEIPISGGLTGMPAGNGAGDPINWDGFYASDGTGIYGVPTNPTVNPNPTGGWMATASQVLSLASSGFRAFAPGSPSVAIPKPKAPGTTLLPQVTTQSVGGVKWSTIAIIGVGVIGAVLLVKFA